MRIKLYSFTTQTANFAKTQLTIPLNLESLCCDDVSFERVAPKRSKKQTPDSRNGSQTIILEIGQ